MVSYLRASRPNTRALKHNTDEAKGSWTVDTGRKLVAPEAKLRA